MMMMVILLCFDSYARNLEAYGHDRYGIWLYKLAIAHNGSDDDDKTTGLVPAIRTVAVVLVCLCLNVKGIRM
jgi:hypothetical protein